jgi:hypothetical protein
MTGQIVGASGRARASVLAALLAIAFVSTQIGELAHVLTQQHAACPEHPGELVDVGPSTGPVHEHATSVLERADASRAREPHDHCAFAPASHARTVGARAMPSVVRGAALHLGAQIAAHEAMPALVPLVFAPKSSPPLHS